MSTPIFFSNTDQFRKWLEKNHKKESEIIVGYYKVVTGKPSMTWSESVDQALCYGWIDGIRRSLDHLSYCIRFTPRRKNSNWSEINIRKVKELTDKGLMKPSGIKVFSERKIAKKDLTVEESRQKDLQNLYVKRLKENNKAWEFFSSQAPSYQKNVMRWILDAKQEKTQISRLEKLIEESKKLKKIYE